MRKFIGLASLMLLLLLGFVYYADEQGKESKTDDLYKQCSGYTFYPAGVCDNESCVPDGLATKVFKEWKKQLMATYEISEDMFTKRIKISNIKLTEGPIYVFWRIEYVFVLGWVRSRQVASINLGKYPLRQEPDEHAIESFVNSEIRQNDRLAIPKVLPYSAVEKALRNCDAGMEADWCHIYFENQTGRLLVKGFATINRIENQCKRMAVNLATGEIIHCTNTPCHIH